MIFSCREEQLQYAVKSLINFILQIPFSNFVQCNLVPALQAHTCIRPVWIFVMNHQRYARDTILKLAFDTILKLAFDTMLLPSE